MGGMVPVKRCADWETRLAAFIEPLRDRPFQYGRHDCAIFAAGAVEAMTGENPMPKVRGRYRTRIGSLRALRRYGAGTLEQTITSILGEPFAPGLAHRGDIVLADGSLGVSLGSFALMVGIEGERDGLVRKPLAEWSCAWRVPF